MNSWNAHIKPQKFRVKKNLFLASNYSWPKNTGYFLNLKKKSSLFSTFKGKLNFNSNKYLASLNNTLNISSFKYNKQKRIYALLYLKPQIHYALFLNSKFTLVLNANKNFVFKNIKTQITNSFWNNNNLTKVCSLLIEDKNLFSDYALFLLGYKQQYLYLTLNGIKNLLNIIKVYKTREISTIFTYKNTIGFPIYLNKLTLKHQLKQVILLRKFNKNNANAYFYGDLKNKIINSFLSLYLNPTWAQSIFFANFVFNNETDVVLPAFKLTINKTLIKKYFLYSLLDSNLNKKTSYLFPTNVKNSRYFYKNMFLSFKSQSFERKKKVLKVFPNYNLYTNDKSAFVYFIQRLNDKYILTGKKNTNLLLLKNLLFLLWNLKDKNKFKFLSTYSTVKNNSKKMWPNLFLTFLKVKLNQHFQYKFNLKSKQLLLKKQYTLLFLNKNKFFNNAKKSRYVYLNRYFITKKVSSLSNNTTLPNNIINKKVNLHKNRVFFYNINKIWSYKKISLPSSKIYVIPTYKKKVIKAQSFVHKKLVTKQASINFTDLKHFLSLLTGQNTSVIFINALTITKYVHKSRAFVKKAVRFYLRKLDNNLINRYRFVAIYIKDLIRISYISLFFKKPTFLANFLAFQLAKLPKNRKETKFIRFLIKAIKIFSGMHREIIALRLQFKGRINRWRRTKVISAQRGFMPLPTYYFRIEYGTSKAITRKGAFGIRIWLRYKLSLMVNLKTYLLNYMKYSKFLRAQRINKFYSQFYIQN